MRYFCYLLPVTGFASCRRRCPWRLERRQADEPGRRTRRRPSSAPCALPPRCCRATIAAIPVLIDGAATRGRTGCWTRPCRVARRSHEAGTAPVEHQASRPACSKTRAVSSSSAIAASMSAPARHARQVAVWPPACRGLPLPRRCHAILKGTHHGACNADSRRPAAA
jgi:hypothetical protein